MGYLSSNGPIGFGLVLILGCGVAPAPPPVPLEGPAADLALLAGEWSGAYRAEKEPPHGTLTLRLRAGSDMAYGDVHMTFAPALRLYGESADAPLARAPCTSIDIAIVRVAGNAVRGTLAPYWDPDCDCRTRTIFEGEVMGDSIAGTFSSRRESRNMPVLMGTWYAIRE
jgi:hypothetical protein